MGHSHGHDHSHHGHHHHHTVNADSINTAFYIGIALNLLFVFIETGVGLWQNSLALLTDAGHNLSDVASLVISLLAFKLAKLKANDKYTYGYKKATVLASLTNAVILLAAVGIITFEAIERFLHGNVALQGLDIAIVAAIGIGVNGFTAYLFFKDQDKDLNIKGAYLHLLADALVSLGVVIGGVLIYFTQWYWIDTILSLIIAFVILRGTWALLKESLSLALDAVPENIDIQAIEGLGKKYALLHEINHIHIWALSTTENALTAHLIVNKDISLSEAEKLKADIKHDLLHLNIHHATLEIARKDSPYKDDCFLEEGHQHEHHEHDEHEHEHGENCQHKHEHKHNHDEHDHDHNNHGHEHNEQED